jgi:hypothetical protein
MCSPCANANEGTYLMGAQLRLSGTALVLVVLFAKPAGAQSVAQDN